MPGKALYTLDLPGELEATCIHEPKSDSANMTNFSVDRRANLHGVSILPSGETTPSISGDNCRSWIRMGEELAGLTWEQERFVVKLSDGTGYKLTEFKSF
jgi:hypothetical protein